MNKIIRYYINSFKGLSHEVWLLAFTTLVNRAGMMVIPFLSIYLTKELGFSLGQVGWIMSAFGVGSLCGSWIGGKLTDRIGGYKTIVISFFLGGIGYVLLQYLKTFEELCIGVFLLTLVADAFRPALFVAMSQYSKPENKTRSVTLIRLAINLGMSFGPAVGGFLILHFGYPSLFWTDGITNILAGIMILLLLNPKKRKVLDEPVAMENPLSPYKDSYYLLFLFALILFVVPFMQLFSTMPLYYKDVYKMSEDSIGLLMGLNAFAIFLIEMPIVQAFESRGIRKLKIIKAGFALLSLSFLVLLPSVWFGWLLLNITIFTIAEIFVFPFANAVAVEQAKAGKHGDYMALFSMNFGLSVLISHNAGLHSIEYFGYNWTWLICAVCSLAGLFILWLLKK